MTLLIVAFSFESQAWNEHPLLVYPSLSEMSEWKHFDKVEVKSLSKFLLENEQQIEVFLTNQELWSRQNLPNYKACPEELAFKATGNPDGILERFFNAIRVNPNIKTPLYLHLLPGQQPEERSMADPTDITTLKDMGVMTQTQYVWLTEGELVLPLDVVATASDEPDYGFDLGLFEDNSTVYGERYGFGKQPFGNPNLEYSSQAPFHMGFFHESKILYKFGPFLKHTFVDYRMFLYKSLSEFSFKSGEPYWGWRFMGWGMHYLGDVTMPYHSQPLPGVSVFKMIWINLKSVLGFKQSKTDAIQLVSNKHNVIEEFQWQVMRRAYNEQNWSHPILTALKHPNEFVPFTDRFMVDNASKGAVERAKAINKVLLNNIPKRFISDPSIEVNDLPELQNIVEVIRDEKGAEAVDAITIAIAERMKSLSMAMQSFMRSVLENSGQQVNNKPSLSLL
ncbi:MAG: hypothetical protein CVT92_08450 [Bacteroidetes bacterium HGW-Bacteroidetes-1]|nr:MAG: hypothetical protein CVT92_08450 [Bacteroidetes bacterium HGW-Bacteroidetes-1]